MKLKKALVIFVFVAMISVCFAGCIEEPSSAPTATPQLSTPEPSDGSVLYVREVSMECRIMDEYTTVYYSIGSNHNKVVEVEVKICIGDNICNIEDPWISPDTPISAWSYFDSLPEYEEPTVEILREIKH